MKSVRRKVDTAIRASVNVTRILNVSSDCFGIFYVRTIDEVIDIYPELFIDLLKNSETIQYA